MALYLAILVGLGLGDRTGFHCYCAGLDLNCCEVTASPVLTALFLLATVGFNGVIYARIACFKRANGAGANNDQDTSIASRKTVTVAISVVTVAGVLIPLALFMLRQSDGQGWADTIPMAINLFIYVLTVAVPAGYFARNRHMRETVMRALKEEVYYRVVQ